MFPDGVVAFVNETTIMQEDLADRLHTLMEQGEFTAPDKQTLARLKKEALEELVKNMLIAQQARRQNITVTDEEFQQRVQQIQAEYGGQDIQVILEQQGESYAEWERMQWETLLLDKLVEVNMGAALMVSVEEAQQYYEQHKEKYDYPAQIRASQILAYEKELAEKALQEIRNGADFAQVAQQYSESQDATQGGDLGFFARGVMPPEFDEVIFSLNMGEVSDVIKTPYGYQIFKLTGQREAHHISFEDAKEQIKAMLAKQKRMAAVDLLMIELQKDAKILLNQEAIEQVR